MLKSKEKRKWRLKTVGLGEAKGKEEEREDVTGGEIKVWRKSKGWMEKTEKRQRKEGADTNLPQEENGS